MDKAHPTSKPLGTLAVPPRSPLLPYEHLWQQSRNVKLLQPNLLSTPAQLLAVAAQVRPRHKFQPGLSDGTLTGFTYPERTLLDPNQRPFDCLQEVNVTLAQMDLESRLGILPRPIGRVPP